MDIDIVFTIGRIVGLIIGLLLIGWVYHKINNRIRSKNNDSNTEKP